MPSHVDESRDWKMCKTRHENCDRALFGITLELLEKGRRGEKQEIADWSERERSKARGIRQLTAQSESEARREAGDS